MKRPAHCPLADARGSASCRAIADRDLPDLQRRTKRLSHRPLVDARVYGGFSGLAIAARTRYRAIADRQPPDRRRRTLMKRPAHHPLADARGSASGLAYMSFWNVALAALPILLASCRAPWTVRPIEEQHPFQADAYVDSIWDSRVVPAARAAMSFQQWDRRAPALVRGTGRFLRRDAEGRLLLDLPPYDGRPDLALACGAAIHGPALRDALPFIQFSQFTNQVEFAKVAAALNDRAARIVPPQSGEIAFAGAAAIPPEGGLPELVPVIP